MIDKEPKPERNTDTKKHGDESALNYGVSVYGRTVHWKVKGKIENEPQRKNQTKVKCKRLRGRAHAQCKSCVT